MIQLFADDAEFREYVSVNVGFEVDNLKNQYNEALTTFIFPYCSEEQFTESLPLTTDEHKEFIRLVKYAAAYLGMYLYAPTAKLLINDGGFHYANDKNKQATADDKEDAILSWKRTGLTAIETIVAYLEKNEDKFPKWKTSSAYTKYNSLLLRTSIEFKIIDDSRQVFLKLIPYIEDVEFSIIKTAIPSNVLAKLYTRAFGADATVKAIYEDLLKNYVQVVVRCLSLASAINAFAIVKDQYNTWTVYDDTGSQKTKGYKDAPNNKLQQYKADLERQGNNRLMLLNQFLLDNAELLEIVQEDKKTKTIPYRNTPTHGTMFF